MINRAIILGRIGFVESKVANNTTYTKLSVATNERWTDKNGEKKEKTTWHNVYGFNKLGEIMAAYSKVGAIVYVEGRITHNKFKDPNGVEKISTSITAEEFKIISGNEKPSQEIQNNGNVELSGNILEDDIPW